MIPVATDLSSFQVCAGPQRGVIGEPSALTVKHHSNRDGLVVYLAGCTLPGPLHPHGHVPAGDPAVNVGGRHTARASPVALLLYPRNVPRDVLFAEW